VFVDALRYTKVAKLYTEGREGDYEYVLLSPVQSGFVISVLVWQAGRMNKYLRSYIPMSNPIHMHET